MEMWCVLCGAVAEGEVEVGAGVTGGLCRDHMEMWLSKHPELRELHPAPHGRAGGRDPLTQAP